MTDDGLQMADGKTQDRRTGPFMAIAILALYASMLLTVYLFRGYPDEYRELGMTELPWLTLMGIRMIVFFKTYWFVVGAGVVPVAAILWKTPLGKAGWMPVAAVFFLAGTLPVVAYYAMKTPIVELQKHLNKGS